MGRAESLEYRSVYSPELTDGPPMHRAGLCDCCKVTLGPQLLFASVKL